MKASHLRPFLSDLDRLRHGWCDRPLSIRLASLAMVVVRCPVHGALSDKVKLHLDAKRRAPGPRASRRRERE